MVNELYERLDHPDLDGPVLVIALDGWIDAGLAAGAALAQLQRGGDWVRAARFDSDVLLDHRARRPTMHLDAGVVTGLSWPAIELWAGTDQRGGDVVLLAGAEPDHLWRQFASSVTDLALALGVRAVHGLGAYPAPVPHTRPVRVVTTAASRELADRIGFVPGRIDVPGGVAAAIESSCADAGLPAAGLWAQVPHYTAAMPYPAAAVALVESLDRVAGLSFETGTLAEDAADTHRRIEALVQANPEHVAMVEQLEQQHDAEQDAGDPGFLMSGDELAAELERFLRDTDS